MKNFRDLICSISENNSDTYNNRATFDWEAIVKLSRNFVVSVELYIYDIEMLERERTSGIIMIITSVTVC